MLRMLGILVEVASSVRSDCLLLWASKTRGLPCVFFCSRSNGQLAPTRNSSLHHRVLTYNTNTTQPYFAARGTTIETKHRIMKDSFAAIVLVVVVVCSCSVTRVSVHRLFLVLGLQTLSQCLKRNRPVV